MNTHKIAIYVGHALTDDRLFGFIFHPAAEYFRIPFLGLGWKDPAEVFVADIENGVGQADLVLLVLDEKSEGVCIELCAAVWHFKTPVLVVYREGTKLRGLTWGFVRSHPQLILERSYKSKAQIPGFIREAIKHFNVGRIISASALRAAEDLHVPV